MDQFEHFAALITFVAGSVGQLPLAENVPGVAQRERNFPAALGTEQEQGVGHPVVVNERSEAFGGARVVDFGFCR